MHAAYIHCILRIEICNTLFLYFQLMLTLTSIFYFSVFTTFVLIRDLITFNRTIILQAVTNVLWNVYYTKFLLSIFENGHSLHREVSIWRLGWRDSIDLWYFAEIKEIKIDYYFSRGE